MKNVISVDLMRKCDAKTISDGISGIELVNRAALSVFNSYPFYGRVAIVCGSGNNGADGYALALILKSHEIDVDIFRTSDKASNDGLFYLNKCLENNIKVNNVTSDTNFDYDIIVDAIFGTGFNKEINDYYSMIFDKINNSESYIISIDINSGLNGNNGMAIKAIKSNLTISIGELKYGHFLNMAKDYIGSVINNDIGIKLIHNDGLLLEENDVKAILKPRPNFSNKGNYGYVGIMGGSGSYPGAIRLASMGQNALYAGAGVSRIIVPEVCKSNIINQVLEATVFSMANDLDGKFIYNEDSLSRAIKGLKSLAIGVGIGISNDIMKILEYLLNNYDGKLIIDADALNCLSQMDLSILNTTKAKIVLTPHLKELSRLTGYKVSDIQNNTVDIALEFVNRYNVTLLVKGPTTLVCNKNALYFINKGTPGMATAGSGDVLTGIIAGVLGYLDNDLALDVSIAAYINGAAGELAYSEYGDYGMVSSDTARMVSKVMARLTK